MTKPTQVLAQEPDQPSVGQTERVGGLNASEDKGVGRGRQLLRAGILLGFLAAVGAFVVLLPDSDLKSAQTALSTADPDAAVPLTRAESLTDAALPPLQTSFERTAGADAADLATLTASTGTPADPAGFDAALSAVADETQESAAQAATTTTVWEEPPMPPESAWVDSGNGVAVPDILLRIRFCESTNNYAAANSGSSARGAYQFLIKSWDWYGHAAVTGVNEAHLATPAQQDEAALRTLQAEGTGPWAESRPCWSNPNLDKRYATAKPPEPPTTTAAPATTSTTATSTETTVPDSGEEPTETTPPTTEGGATPDTTPQGEPPAETTTTTPDPAQEESTSTTVSPASENP